MTVEELIGELQQMDPEAEVRIAEQPSWPFEYSIDGVVAADLAQDPHDENYRNGYPNQNVQPQVVVYLVEGQQLAYLPEVAACEIGWSRSRD